MSDAPAASINRANNNDGPSKERLERILKAANVINAMFLGATGVLAFILLGSPLSISEVFSACYVIIFSLLLLCFECHFGFMDEIIYRNFGFMFNWGGRLVFLFLNGVLAFALGPMGIAAGCFTGFVITVNMFILCRYRDFAESYEADAKALRRAVAARQTTHDSRGVPTAAAATPGGAAADFGARPAGAGGAGGAYSGAGLGGALVDAAVRNPDAAIAVGSAAVSVASNPAVQRAAAGAADSRNPFLDVAPAASSSAGSSGGSRRGEMTEANGWKKYLDDKSGKYYYYHEQTKETRWDTDDL